MVYCLCRLSNLSTAGIAGCSHVSRFVYLQLQWEAALVVSRVQLHALTWRSLAKDRPDKGLFHLTWTILLYVGLFVRMLRHTNVELCQESHTHRVAPPRCMLITWNYLWLALTFHCIDIGLKIMRSVSNIMFKKKKRHKVLYIANLGHPVKIDPPRTM